MESRLARFPFRIARSVRVLLREEGLPGLVKGIGNFLFCKERMELYAVDLSKGFRAPPLDPRVEIRPAEPRDLEQLRATPEGGQTEFHRDQIDGAEPWVALWEGRLAHIGWIYDSPIPTRFTRLRKGEAELRFAYTLEEFRGRGLYATTNAVMAEELAQRGYRRAYGIVIDYGTAFRLGLGLALRHVGFERVRNLIHLRVCGIQLRPYLSL